jgi:hypothetical protein
VKLDKLLKRLKRDATASPQKAGALALMVIVALYFWAPLVMKGFKGKAKLGKGTAATQIILGDDPILVKAAVHPANNSAHWDRVREVLAQDRLMQAAVHQVNWQNPFQPLEHEDAKATPKNRLEEPNPGANPLLPTKPAVENDVAKQLLSGVTLSSVMVGKKASAIIRGKRYRVGDVLLFGDDNSAPKIEFRITAIDEEGIDLRYDGQPFRIERTKPTLTTGELQRD